jgi:hypothetical protein
VPVGGRYVFGAYPLDVDVNYAKNHAANDQWTWYYLTVGQLSAYLQDEWQMGERFRITYGLRVDKALYSNASYSTPNLNADGTFAGSFITGEPTVPNNDNLVLFDADGKPVKNGVGKDLDNTRLPEGLLFSPRLGFNWYLNGNKTTQIRGGSGLFTGRFPFVWIGNHIGNPFSSFYNATDKDFRWPQVWRSNLGMDWKTRFGTVFTLDVAYTKDMQAMMVRNYKLGTPTGTLNSGIGDKRKIYTAGDQGAVNTYVFTNTDEGYQFNFTFQVQQTFRGGLYMMAAYNYLKAEDASSISAEISSDAFDRNPILNNANEARLTPSLYGNKHRFIAALSKKFEYGAKKRLATTLSVFGNWSSGNRYAYVYGGDINNDGTASNDLMYVPTDAEIDVMPFAAFTDINGNVKNAATQREALKWFIEQDNYLKNKRGAYTEKYGAETPWFSQLDVRLLQDFKMGKGTNTIQLSMDIVNFGNLLNSEWGVRRYATTSGYFQPLSVSLSGATPTYQFDPTARRTFVSSPDLISRWQLQFGIRYLF